MSTAVADSLAEPVAERLAIRLDEHQARAVAALLRCVGRYGLAKTNLDDVAREAGCSRATLYRWVDAKPELLRLAVASEEARLLGLLRETIAGAADLPEAIVVGVVTAARELAGHEALQFLLAHEPATVYGHLSFAEGDALMLHIADALAPAFARWLPRDTGPGTDGDAAQRAADWLVRVVRTCCLTPKPALDLTDEALARAFLEQFVIPGIAGHRESRSA
jgi:AcrR family transcriptional regulator